jgi:Mn2+/Fe2+ NRAMP family transporter
LATGESHGWLRETVVPTIRLDSRFLLALLATVGTTMTPWGCAYMQASVANDRNIMQNRRNSRWINALAIGLAVLITVATVFLLGDALL